MAIKCLLIVSQYNYSHHMLIVEPPAPGEYLDKARALIEALEDIKRAPQYDKRDYEYGDMCEANFCGMHRRHNVNDISGDIYFIPCKSVEQAASEMKMFAHEEDKGVRAVRESDHAEIKIGLYNEVCSRHPEYAVKDAMKKHFAVM